MALFLFAGYAGLLLLAGLLLFKFKGLKKRMATDDQSSAPDGSLRDPVTGLYNRKHLLQRLSEYIARSERDKKPFAVVLWDIDGFAKFNNEFGQKDGDRLLVNVCEIIRRSLRSYDEAFRSGPDEFCALLSPADETMAESVSKRVSETVSRNLFEGVTTYSRRGFSLPAGFILYPNDNKTPEAILHAVAQALYKSKLTLQTESAV